MADPCAYATARNVEANLGGARAPNGEATPSSVEEENNIQYEENQRRLLAYIKRACELLDAIHAVSNVWTLSLNPSSGSFSSSQNHKGPQAPFLNELQEQQGRQSAPLLLAQSSKERISNCDSNDTPTDNELQFSKVPSSSELSSTSTATLTPENYLSDFDSSVNANALELKSTLSQSFLSAPFYRVLIASTPTTGAPSPTNKFSSSCSPTLDRAIADARTYLAQLDARLCDRACRILVAGDLNSGKSTYVNALLRRDLLPTDQQPLTSVFTEIIHASNNENGAEEVHLVHLQDPATSAGDIKQHSSAQSNDSAVANVVQRAPLTALRYMVAPHAKLFVDDSELSDYSTDTQGFDSDLENDHSLSQPSVYCNTENLGSNKPNDSFNSFGEDKCQLASEKKMDVSGETLMSRVAASIRGATSFGEVKATQNNTADSSDSASFLRVYCETPREDCVLVGSNLVDVRLIDTPGLNRDFMKTYAIMKRQREIDVIVFLVNAENQITLSAREFLAASVAEKAYVFVVVTMFDKIMQQRECKRVILRQIKDILPETYSKRSQLVHFVALPRSHNFSPAESCYSSQIQVESKNGFSAISSSTSKSAAASSGFVQRGIGIRDDATFATAERSLKNFLLSKRSASKLSPAKRYLDNLLIDLEKMLGLNLERVQNFYKTCKIELDEMSEPFDYLCAKKKCILSVMESLIENSSAKINEAVLERLQAVPELLVTRARDGVEYPGFWHLATYVRNLRCALLEVVVAEIKVCRALATNEIIQTWREMTRQYSNWTSIFDEFFSHKASFLHSHPILSQMLSTQISGNSVQVAATSNETSSTFSAMSSRSDMTECTTEAMPSLPNAETICATLPLGGYMVSPFGLLTYQSRSKRGLTARKHVFGIFPSVTSIRSFSPVSLSKCNDKTSREPTAVSGSSRKGSWSTALEWLTTAAETTASRGMSVAAAAGTYMLARAMAGEPFALRLLLEAPGDLANFVSRVGPRKVLLVTGTVACCAATVAAASYVRGLILKIPEYTAHALLVHLQDNQYAPALQKHVVQASEKTLLRCHETIFLAIEDRLSQVKKAKSRLLEAQERAQKAYDAIEETKERCVLLQKQVVCIST